MNLDFLDLSGKVGVFDQLKIANGGEELTDSMKDKFLNMIDIEKDDKGYYLDSEDKQISYDGRKGMKKADVMLNLSAIHINEIQVSAKNFKYFRKNYCKILNKGFYSRPDPRPYQERAEDAILSGDDIVMLFPRQCVSGDTLIYVDNTIKPIKQLFLSLDVSIDEENDIFKESKKVLEIVKTKGINSNPLIKMVHKTIPLNKYKIILSNKMELECSENHIIIDENYNEIQARNSLGINIITEKGIFKVIECTNLNIKEEFYDLTIDSYDSLFYTNGILSHNSGKTVTIATYLLHNGIFRENITIGIAVNTLKLAKEVLSKIKEIYLELPIWMMPGLRVWNRTEIEFDNRTKIVATIASGTSFKGHSLSLCFVDETSFLGYSNNGNYNPEVWEAFQDDTAPALSAVPGSQIIYASTSNGINHFYHMVMGAKKHKIEILDDKSLIELEDGLRMTTKEIYNKGQNYYPKEIKSLKKESENKYILTYHKGINGMRLVEADWKEVPRFKKNGNLKTNDEFKQEIIEKKDELHFQQNYGNCVGYDTNINIESLNYISIGELYDNQDDINICKVLKSPLKVLTPKGYRSFIGIQKYNKKTYKVTTNNKSIEVAELHKFVVDNIEIYCKDLDIGSKLETIGGYDYVTDIEILGTKDVYDLMSVEGEIYYTNDILSHNSFLGSSDTLISTDALKSIQPSEDEHITFDKLFQGLRTFNDPIAGHHYIVTCDPKKKGTDPAGIQVIDVTKLPFVQVATAQLDEDFMTLPEKLFILGNEYNQAMVVSENNIGESIPATLFYQYEYEGEVFTERDSNGVYKKEMGFRTKVNTKIQILTLMKKFIESGDLIIQDRKTLDELFNFVKKPNGTYSADGSNTDDLVMSLAITFAPFIDFKNWDNFKGFIEYIERKKEVEEKEDDDFVEFLDLGFSSDLGISEEVTGFTKDLWGNESYNDLGGSFG